MQGLPQEPVSIEDGDGYSRVIKRVVLKSDTEQSEVRPCAAPTLTYGGDMVLRGHTRCAGMWQSALSCTFFLLDFVKL